MNCDLFRLLIDLVTLLISSIQFHPLTRRPLPEFHNYNNFSGIRQNLYESFYSRVTEHDLFKMKKFPLSELTPLNWISKGVRYGSLRQDPRKFGDLLLYVAVYFTGKKLSH